jgi:multiple sugar transport system ATP-binding protein
LENDLAGIVFEGVNKRYSDGHQALCDFDLDVADGEFLVLVGPSGCGKSTALRSVAGLEEISGGKIWIDGKVVNNLAPRDRDVAMIFQNYALYPHMTIRDNIGFGLRVRGINADERNKKIEETAQILELTEHLDRKPGKLSGGQRQRVAMGRAIARTPNAFLMDEPLSNLDAKLRGQMRTEIKAIQKITGVTTIYVTHDQVEAMTMGTRVAVMKSGEIQQLGVPKDIYSRPKNVFVARFIGSPAMNILICQLEQRADKVYANYGEQSILLSPKIVNRLSNFDLSSVMIGIRSEQVLDGDLKDGNPNAANYLDFSGRIFLAEELGSTSLMHIDVKGTTGSQNDEGASDLTSAILKQVDFLAILSNEIHVEPGKSVNLKVAAANVHLFNPHTGNAL